VSRTLNVSLITPDMSRTDWTIRIDSSTKAVILRHSANLKVSMSGMRRVNDASKPAQMHILTSSSGLRLLPNKETLAIRGERCFRVEELAHARSLTPNFQAPFGPRIQARVDVMISIMLHRTPNIEHETESVDSKGKPISIIRKKIVSVGLDSMLAAIHQIPKMTTLKEMKTWTMALVRKQP